MLARLALLYSECLNSGIKANEARFQYYSHAILFIIGGNADEKEESIEIERIQGTFTPYKFLAAWN